jgi:nucleoside-diphosphate-sugar epimerase
MNILTIGGSGFVGTNLIKELENSNCQIQNIDKSISKIYPELTTIADIRNKNELLSAINSNTDTVILLAAEHKDNVDPTSLYYDVNVDGTRNVLKVIEKNGINNIIFTSSVAVYGLNKPNPDENSPVDPFNHYGKSKWQAEEILREWYNKDPQNRSLTIIRPTVIFGERNRGNVYNLLKQIASGKFMMVGTGKNKKSMSYVGNVTAFIKHCVETAKPGYRLFNYVDKPDLSMNELVKQVEQSLNRKISSLHLPYTVGYLGGLSFDIFSKLTGKEFPVSAVRVKKFCATTQFDSKIAHSSGFIAPYTLQEGLHRTLNYEFGSEDNDKIVFDSE